VGDRTVSGRFRPLLQTSLKSTVNRAITNQQARREKGNKVFKTYKGERHNTVVPVYKKTQLSQEEKEEIAFAHEISFLSLRFPPNRREPHSHLISSFTLVTPDRAEL